VSGHAVAVAHPNVALSKYWGKLPGAGNFPAVPSLSVTLAGLQTRTSVTWSARGAGGERELDRVVLNGIELLPAEASRAQALLDGVRKASGRTERAVVESRNDFPTASGLASSASGFAALALAAVRSAGLDWDAGRVSDLARSASASAARSVFGGFVELPVGQASACPVAPASQLPLVVLVCVTAEGPKAVGSTDGMRRTLERSPYARAWLDQAPRLHDELRAALLAGDFQGVGERAEASALAMHASAIAAGVVYWNGATLEALAAVRALREGGLLAYATIDAGPHVKVLVRPADEAQAKAVLEAVPGVKRVLEAHPGEGARLEASS
jgi:diphosphomevalonate decarboxylase